MALTTLTKIGKGITSLFKARGATHARELSDRFSDEINVKDYGAIGDGVADDTSSIQLALDKGKRTLLPLGTYKITSPLFLKEGYWLEGVCKTGVKIVGSTSSNILETVDWGHNVVLKNLTLDGDRKSKNCIKIKRSFGGIIDNVEMIKAADENLRIERDVYFWSFSNLWLLDAPIGINIAPVINTDIEHAVVNDNKFDMVQIRNFHNTGMKMFAAAGNTFTNFNYEVAPTSAVQCLTIDHCHNNKFISNWFEPNNYPSMQRLVYLNDFQAAYYTRNNVFDNCYFVGGTSGNVKFHIIMGTCLRNSILNSTFHRASSCLQVGSSTKYPFLDQSNTYHFLNSDSKIMTGSAVDRMPIRRVYGSFVLDSSNDTYDLNFTSEGTDLKYDGVYATGFITKFSGASDLQKTLSSYKYSDHIRFFHSGAPLTGGNTIQVDYELVYYAHPNDVSKLEI